jgi:hypothetical protein
MRATCERVRISSSLTLWTLRRFRSLLNRSHADGALDGFRSETKILVSGFAENEVDPKIQTSG